MLHLVLHALHLTNVIVATVFRMAIVVMRHPVAALVVPAQLVIVINMMAFRIPGALVADGAVQMAFVRKIAAFV